MANAFQTSTDALKPRYITKTEAVYDYRTNYGVIGRLIKEGKIALHLIDGKIMLDGDEAAREITNFKNRYARRPNLFA
jgi:hypothetical protein